MADLCVLHLPTTASRIPLRLLPPPPLPLLNQVNGDASADASTPAVFLLSGQGCDTKNRGGYTRSLFFLPNADGADAGYGVPAVDATGVWMVTTDVGSAEAVLGHLERIIPNLHFLVVPDVAAGFVDGSPASRAIAPSTNLMADLAETYANAAAPPPPPPATAKPGSSSGTTSPGKAGRQGGPVVRPPPLPATALPSSSSSSTSTVPGSDMFSGACVLFGVVAPFGMFGSTCSALALSSATFRHISACCAGGVEAVGTVPPCFPSGSGSGAGAGGGVGSSGSGSVTSVSVSSFGSSTDTYGSPCREGDGHELRPLWHRLALTGLPCSDAGAGACRARCMMTVLWTEVVCVCPSVFVHAVSRCPVDRIE